MHTFILFIYLFTNKKNCTNEMTCDVTKLVYSLKLVAMVWVGLRYDIQLKYNINVVELDQQ